MRRRTQSPGLRRLPGRALRVGRPGSVRAGPAPAVRRRRDLSSCPHGDGTMRRVPEVIDALVRLRVDAVRAMGIPARGRQSPRRSSTPTRRSTSARRLDQTRGWFYTLMAVGTLVFDRSSYENVLCLGLILADDGRRMSKHLGNILEPMPLMDEHGADARPMVHGWRADRPGCPPGRPRNDPGERAQGPADLLEHRVVPVALRAGPTVGRRPRAHPAAADRPVLDRWALSETATGWCEMSTRRWTRSTPSGRAPD